VAVELQLDDEVLHHNISVNKIFRTVTTGGRTVHLTFKEFAMFYILASNPHRVISQQQLLKEVWHEDSDEIEKVAVHMVRLRKKLNPDRQRHQAIRTIWGAGYLFVPAHERA
jgi:DNA-binding response OmpR family regulator